MPRPRDILGLAWVLIALSLGALADALQTLANRVATCHPDPKYGTYVWHRHSIFNIVWRTYHPDKDR